MKLFLMYYDRYETATTSKMIDIEHFVLCHSNKDKFNCIGDKGTLLETGEPKGIQNNFNYGLDMLEDGEWGIFMSDDLIGAKKIKDGKFIDCDIMHPINEIINIIPIAESGGIKLIGLNNTGNSFYFKNNFSYSGLVDGRCFAIKKTSFKYHSQINTIPDYYATIYHKKKYRYNLIINYTFLDFKRYEKGGLGSIDERMKDKIKDIDIIRTLYPNSIDIKEKANHQSGSHIIIKK
jgi:hypothetical protein